MEQFKGLYDKVMTRVEAEQGMPGVGQATTAPRVFRVIDDGTCVLTTMDSEKALYKMMELIDKHDITACWAEAEILE